jgi:hypothetical protein
MTAIRFDPWAELAAIENAECGGAPAKVAKPAKVVSANVPAEWVDGVARLISIPYPAMVRPHRWRLAVKDARRLLRDWAAQASALGWTTVDIFGCHPTHPVERLDCAGLILLLHGDQVAAITNNSACTRTRTGATLSYCRRPRPESVPLWELAEVLPADAEAAR